MSVLIFLIPIALATALLGLAAFLWSLKSKQYEDLQGAASRILFDDEEDFAPKKDGANIRQNDENAKKASEKK